MDYRRRARDFLTNWDQPMPWPEKSAKLVRNLLLRLVRPGCCGHHGEPGC